MLQIFGMLAEAEVAFDMTAVVNGIKTVLSTFLTNLTITNIASVLAIVLTACLGLYLFYWGVRKGLSALKNSFEGGGLHI